MKVLQALVLLITALVVAGQRPSFAGSRPIGYPELANRTTTPSGLEDKFGEGTTQRLPIEAGGDRDLIDRLSKLPIDKQPFWFINWQAYEANREKPQTYPLKPNPFIEGNLQNTANTNTGVSNDNSGSITSAGSVSTNSGSISPNPSLVDGSQNGINNKNGNPNVIDNTAAIKIANENENENVTKKIAPEKEDTGAEDSTRKPDPPFVVSVPLVPIYLNRNENIPFAISSYPINTDTDVDKNVETQNVDVTKKSQSDAPAEIESSKTPNENIAATIVTNVKTDIVKEPTKPETTTEIKNIETDRVSDHIDTDAIADKKDEQLSLNASDNEKLNVESEDNNNLETATDTQRKYKYSRVVFSPEDDDYEDIKVKDDIKLFPGIIQRYRK